MKFSQSLDKCTIYAEFDLQQRKNVFLVVSESIVNATDRLIAYHSSWYKLTLSTAWLLRYKQYLKRRVKGNDVSSAGQQIDVLEIQQTALALIKYVQCQEFPEWFS